MDAHGARELRKRLDQQKHWRLAEAVQTGRLPATDPDTSALEEIGDGIRLYRRESHDETVEGRRAQVTRRLVKRLVDGWWEGSYDVERVDSLPDPAPGGHAA